MSIDPVSQSNAAKVASQNIANQANPQAKEPPPAQDSNPVKTQPAAVTDTVKISNAGKIAVQEATETSAQTAKEARSGDIQAKKVLAKQAATEEANESTLVKSQEAH